MNTSTDQIEKAEMSCVQARGSVPGARGRAEESGFSLVEVVIAMVILLIVLLAVFASFTYAVTYNAGNNARSEALVIMQQEAENLRSARFTSGVMDASLTGGVKPQRQVTAPSGNRFLVDVTIDDDPFTAGVQVNNSLSLKQINLNVSLASPTPGWQTSIPITAIVQRVRGN